MRSSVVIDAHTHAFSPEIMTARSDFIRRDLWFGHLYENPRSLLATADDVLASMDNAGIGQSVLCGFPWRDAGICRDQNDYLAQVVRLSAGRLTWLASVSPVEPGADQEAARAFASGAVGIGELNADAQGFDLRDSAALAGVAEVCIAHQRPILMHVSEPVGHAYPGKGTATPDRLVAMLTMFPQLRVVAAHWGGGLPFYELMPEVAGLTSRVTYDSAASTYLYRFDVFRTVIDLVGPDRVMFASDYPVLRQDRFLRRVERIPMTDAERHAVMVGTAARVYGLEPLESNSIISAGASR